MITQHLYTTDTVSATFLSSFFGGDVKTTALCAKELLVSGEKEQLRRLATFAWLHDDPTYNTANRLETFTTDGFLQTLLTERRVVPMEIAPSMPPTPYETPTSTSLPWTLLPHEWTAGMANTVWKAVRDALAHKNYTRAMFLTAYLVHDQSNVIANLLTGLGVKKVLIELLEATTIPELRVRILNVAYASLVYTKREEANLNPVVEHILSTTLPLGRAGRNLAISANACAEWAVQIPQDAQFIGPVTFLKNGTSFWRNVLDSHSVRIGKELEFPNDDDAVESFYTTYFPDDIPDEWSLQERQKSHGFAASDMMQSDLAFLFREFVL
jgi:hypothetical protein